MTTLAFDRLEERLLQLMEQHRVPGLALSVISDAQIVLTKGLGHTSIEAPTSPVTPDTLFRIGSTSKPLTGTLIMRLLEQGLLDLDVPIQAYLPWFEVPDPCATATITLRHLLSHQAGIGIDLILHGRQDDAALREYVQQTVMRWPLVAPAGKVFAYSDAPMVAACAAEAVTGQPFARLMQQYVFEPLAMEHSTYDPLVAMTYSVALTHDSSEDGTVRVDHRFADNVAEYPVAFALSTARDLTHFAQMQLQQGTFNGQVFLQPGSIKEMHTPHADLYTLTSRAYGLTFFVDSYKGVQKIGHPGNISSYGCYFELIPAQGAAIILLCNRAGSFWQHVPGLVNELFDTLLDLPASVSQPAAVAPDRSLFPQMVGHYLHPEIGLQTIAIQGDCLLIEAHGAARPLDCVRRDLFMTQDGQTSVGFVLEASQPAAFIVVDGRACARYQPTPADSLDPALWDRYAGTYIDMFGARATVTVTDGGLIVEAPAYLAEPAYCTPLTNICFTSKSGLFELDIDDDDTIQYIIWQRGLGFKPAGAGHEA